MMGRHSNPARTSSAPARKVEINTADEAWVLAKHYTYHDDVKQAQHYEGYIRRYDPTVDTSALATKIVQGEHIDEWERMIALYSGNTFDASSRLVLWDDAPAILAVLMDNSRLAPNDSRLLMAWSLLHRLLHLAHGEEMMLETARAGVSTFDAVTEFCYKKVTDIMALAVTKQYLTDFPDVAEYFLAPYLQSLRVLTYRAVRGNSTENFKAAYIDAEYKPQDNSITITAGMMLPPIFILDAAAAMNYGGFGQIVGHEMMHAYDVRGIKLTHEGRSAKYNATDTLQEYERKVLCLRASYQKAKQCLSDGSVNLSFTSWRKSKLTWSHGCLQCSSYRDNTSAPDARDNYGDYNSIDDDDPYDHANYHSNNHPNNHLHYHINNHLTTTSTTTPTTTPSTPATTTTTPTTTTTTTHTSSTTSQATTPTTTPTTPPTTTQTTTPTATTLALTTTPATTPTTTPTTTLTTPSTAMSTTAPTTLITSPSSTLSTTQITTSTTSTGGTTSAPLPVKPLVCTVGYSATAASMYPPDRYCDYLYYRDVVVMNNTLRAARNEASWQAFQDQTSAYRQVQLGVSFDFGQITVDKLNEAAQNLTSLSAKNVKHYGMLNVMTKSFRLREVVNRLKDIFRKMKSIQNDPQATTIIAIGLHDYSARNAWNTYRDVFTTVVK
ncbi:hypothetical protein V5799_009229 [Amblyomma americanum]|uniref:Peptidase M13 C-terminal domain-containing protein n=1 Tax=Amblyomma americanum TaxID=6943 RepID=A0AAQ4FBP2_AMBAM